MITDATNIEQNGTTLTSKIGGGGLASVETYQYFPGSVVKRFFGNSVSKEYLEVSKKVVEALITILEVAGFEFVRRILSSGDELLTLKPDSIYGGMKFLESRGLLNPYLGTDETYYILRFIGTQAPKEEKELVKTFNIFKEYIFSAYLVLYSDVVETQFFCHPYGILVSKVTGFVHLGILIENWGEENDGLLYVSNPAEIDDTQTLRSAMFKLKGIAVALDRMQKLGLRHNDVKPNNFFLRPVFYIDNTQYNIQQAIRDGVLILGDFGITSTLNQHSLYTFRGTFRYCAPEIIANMIFGPEYRGCNLNSINREDLYSFGLSILDIILGVQFNGEDLGVKLLLDIEAKYTFRKYEANLDAFDDVVEDDGVLNPYNIKTNIFVPSAAITLISQRLGVRRSQSIEIVNVIKRACAINPNYRQSSCLLVINQILAIIEREP